MQVSLYRQLYRPIHARLLLDFNKVLLSASVSVESSRLPLPKSASDVLHVLVCSKQCHAACV